MKAKLTMMVAMAVACAAIKLTAMPTEEETKQAEPVVRKMLAQERAALKSGKMTRSEVAAAAMGLADKAESDAEKLLLMKGACDFYVHAGEFDKAIETLQTIMTKIPDIPYATIVSILESSLRGVPRNSAKYLYAFLDETKSSLRNTDATHGKKVQSETNIQKFYRLFPGWEICKDAQEKEKLGFELAYRGQFNVAVLHPVSKEIPAVVSRTLKLSGKNPCLFLKVSSCDYSGEADWVLSVRVNGKEVLPKRLVVKSPISEPWEDIAVPLFAWRGQEVKVEVVVTANGWFCEFAYFKRLEIAEGSGRENLIPEATETVGGYTWSYRVQNGEATIISEKEGKDSCAVSPKPVGSIVIPDILGGAKVTSIGRDALAGCQELESVTIPQGVKRIGRGAFFECKKLKSVEIPSSVTEIDWCAFYRCNALASVAIPSDSELKTLENGAFAECFELKSIAIPDGVTRIARHAFLGCFNIKSLTIPATASNIGGEAFRFCANLSSVTMLGEKPDTSVPPVNRSRTSDNIFLDCGKLKSIHVPANAKSWAGMKEWHGIPLVFDADVETDGSGNKGRDVEYKFNYKLEGGNAIITSIDPKSVGTAGPVGSLVIPDKIDGHSVTHIGWEAFRNCKDLTSVMIPEGVTHIDYNAFCDCSGLKSVTLPSSLKNIGWGAFGRCVGLTSVTIPNGVKCIWHDAFNGCSGLKSVLIPDSVTSIGDRAFIGCRELETVSIPAGVASIGKGVFGECNALKIINVDSGSQAVASIDGVLYTKDRSELVMYPNPPASVVIPKDVKSIRGWAFAGCRGMTSVTIPESVTSIGDVVFLDCVGLKSITIPPSVTSIGEHAFERCVELTEVTMLGERPEAPKNLFPGCRKLKAIHVPANAKSWAGMKEWFGIPLVFDAK